MTRLLLIPFAATALLLLACGEGSNVASVGGGARWSDSANATLLNQLPAYSGATLVREWEVSQDGEDINRPGYVDIFTVHVRQYAVATPPEQAADAITLHYRGWLIENGWTEAQPRAAFSTYTREQGGGASRLIIGRVGPRLMETPPNAKSISRADPPAGSQFFYTLEMTADWKGSAPR
ncbi:MAG: hypothetical protein GEU75_11185 [Dehalococcoidia bacterium]|nr:hypothetical protein [Dehalococcoidia bacterium]